MSTNYIKRFLEEDLTGLDDVERDAVASEISRKNQKINWDMLKAAKTDEGSEEIKKFYERYPEMQIILDEAMEIAAKYAFEGEMTYQELFEKMSDDDIQKYNALIERSIKVQRQIVKDVIASIPEKYFG